VAAVAGAGTSRLRISTVAPNDFTQLHVSIAPSLLVQHSRLVSPGPNSLKAVHPELIAEWNVKANKPLRPERIKATYDKAVVWNCRDDPSFPTYKMSPVTRAKRAVGCSICRKKKPANDLSSAQPTVAA
jgi:hypothetical protein